MSRTATDSFPATRSSLLSRVRHPSDAESWRVFHAQYARLVYQVCLRAGLKPEDCDDVAQEALAAVAEKMPQFQLDRSKGNFRGWLYRITANKVADFLRRKYRENRVREEAPPGMAEDQADDENFIEAAWESEWQDYLLQRALEAVKDHVSARAMQIFHLSAVKGWSVDQVRQNLGLSRTQVYLARFRVSQVVKKEIARLRKELD